MYYFNFLTESKEDCCQWQDFSGRKYQGCHGMAPIDFGRSINPISARGHFMPTTLLLVSPDFQTFLRTCGMELRNCYLPRTGESFLVYNNFIYPLPTTKQQKTKKASKHLSHSLSWSPHGFINFQLWIVLFVNYCFFVLPNYLFWLKIPYYN